MGLFQTLRQSDIASRVDQAHSLVIYAAPGVSVPVAAALVRLAQRIRPDNVVAILDVSAHSARMGYGCFEAARQLLDAGINVRVEPGLRQGLLIVDNSGWAFALPAQLVEADTKDDEDAPNAIELTTAQILILRGELPQPARTLEAATSTGALPAVMLGAAALTERVVQQVTRELQVAPPQPFDLARQVQVYTALVRFVELEMKGWKLESRRVELPKTLPVLATQDRDLKQRIKSTLNLLDQIQDGQLRTLRAEVDEIRKAFCVPVGGLGSVVLVQVQQELIKRVDAVKLRFNKARESIKGEIEANRGRLIDSLVPELARAVRGDPPDPYRARFAQTQEGAEEYVRRELTRVFPDAEEIVKGMSLRLTFKDVTYDVLKDEGFKDRVLTSFSRSVLPGELLTEYDAARERVASSRSNAGTTQSG
jgi:hypothetical protein